MSRLIGDRLPAPLRFEFGMPASAGEMSRAVLLASVDDDGCPRFAVLSTAEVTAPDDRRLRVELHADSSTCANLKAHGKVAIWYVLDAAAFTVKGRATAADGASADGWQRFEIEIDSVWQDFRSDAPMVSGPMYRTPAEG